MTKEFDKHLLPERIVATRKKAGLNQAQLAEKAGVTPAAISQIENGLRTPTIPVLRKITSVLNVSLDYLTGRSDESDLQDILQDQEVQTFYRGFKTLDPGDKKTIMDTVEFLRSKHRNK
jgi:transcriptional regulator with XRE-family HTH domain